MDKFNRYKLKNKEKVSAKWIATRMHKNKKLCSFKNCKTIGERHHPDYKQPKIIVWLCREHHNIIHGKVKKKCSICNNVHHAKGFCKKHYRLKET